MQGVVRDVGPRDRGRDGHRVRPAARAASRSVVLAGATLFGERVGGDLLERRRQSGTASSSTSAPAGRSVRLDQLLAGRARRPTQSRPCAVSSDSLERPPSRSATPALRAAAALCNEDDGDSGRTPRRQRPGTYVVDRHLSLLPDSVGEPGHVHAQRDHQGGVAADEKGYGAAYACGSDSIAGARRVASQEPRRTSGKPIAMPRVKGSSRMTRPSRTATAGLT